VAKDNVFPVQRILELACAAQRVNGEYVKESIAVYSSDDMYMYSKQTNKILMLVTVDPTIWTADPKDKPPALTVLPEDVAHATEVRNHFKRFLFGAIEGTNDFQTSINAILSNETIKAKEFGYVACLPSVYVRDKAHLQVKRAARHAEEGYLGEVGSQLIDLDCEILESVKSKNFEGYNISAIINSKMVSWLNKTELKIGPCVIVKAKVKDHSKHWKHQNDVTRLNYVKAVQ